MITRLRGGAQIVRQEHLAPPFERRIGASVEAKQKIAERALQFLPVGGSLFLDSSTTCLYLARAIDRTVKERLTLVTNGPLILSEFSSPNVRLIGTPGELDLDLRALGGPWTVEFLEKLNLNVAFISGIGLTLDGRLTTTKRLIVDVVQQATRRSQATYALVDSSQLGHQGMLDIAQTSDLDGLIVDSGISPDQVHALKHHGVNVIVAE
jgi:DeoR/GlpR family transcriptional regulator of sugar metabolism